MSTRLAQASSNRWPAVAVVVFALVGGCSPELSLDELRSYQRTGRFAETIEPLRARLEETPDDLELNHLYGVALLQTGQAALAIWPLRKSAQDPDRAVDDGLLLVNAILVGGSAPDAVVVANQVLEIAPDRVDVLRLLIKARLKAKQNEEALEDIDRLLELMPGDSGALISRLVALLGLDRVDEAEQTLAEVSEAVTNLEGGFEWEPRVCGGTATFMQEKGDLEAAEKLWNDCLEQFPAEGLIVFNGVEFFTEISKPGRVGEILQRAYELEPTHLPFIEAHAHRLARAGQTEEAERILFAATEDGVNDQRAWFTLSDYYEQRDELARAAEAIGTGLALMGEAPPLLGAEYVDLLIRAGEYEKAEELLPSFEAEPLLSNLLRGRLLLVRGKAAEAIEAFEEGIRLWPDNSAARELVAQAYEQIGDYDRAVTEYAEAMRVEAGNRDAVFLLLRLLDALDRDDEAFLVLERYQRAKPSDSESTLQFIRIAGRIGKMKSVQQAARRLGEAPSYRGRLVAELAAMEASIGGAAAGIDYIRNAGFDLTRPMHGAALRALVEYLVAEGKHSEALREADAALAARPDEPLFHELRAHALRAAGEAGLAREAFERARELEPKRASAIAGLAELAAERGERAAAIALYDRAARADPDDSRYAWEAIQLVAASGDDAEVERRLEALLLGDALHGEALGLRARQLLTRDPERALSLARRAARLRGGPDALDLLGRIQLERGDAKQAAGAFRRSIALQPDRPSAHYWLGMALAARGDAEGARSELSAALEADSFPEREDAQAQLAGLNGD
ncbi:MAG: tetratricopeptide repeat protein [Myxococcales bacterium]|nr:tetratricopeptide repeat protein [Myxococcales bacterium]